MTLENTNAMKKIGIIGLGYVGLPLAVEFGKNRTVIGFDINKNRVAELRDFQDHTLECTTEQLKSAEFLTFSSDLKDLQECQIFIVTVPTPIDSANRPDLTPLIKASQTIGKVVKNGDIVIFESTVYPGATEEVCVPEIERISGLNFNVDFSCGYSPERINPGDKLNTLTTIKKITSGSNEDAAIEINNLYASIIKAGTHLASSIKVAEAAKVIENTQRDLNIALVNELSVVFDRLGIDTLEVLEAAGTKWNFLPFRPGLVGGHCIGVDPYYLTHKSEQLGYYPEVILAGRRINDNMAVYAAQRIIKELTKNGINISECRIGVMGVTFKDNCPDIRNSKVVDLIAELKEWGANVTIYDPWADKADVKEEYSLDLSSADEFHNFDGLVVAVGHEEFKNMSVQDVKKLTRGENPVVADIKSIFDLKSLLSAGFTVFRL